MPSPASANPSSTQQILASARAGSEVSKQICAVEHAFGIYMSQLQAGSGECDADSVLRGLQATIDSAQTQVIRFMFLRFGRMTRECMNLRLQNAASRMNDTEYTQHLDRLVSNLKKHTSEGDDDEVGCSRGLLAIPSARRPAACHTSMRHASCVSRSVFRSRSTTRSPSTRYAP